ncbi:hypothetical protein EDB92DRAFT_2037552 [Lactarius akahatsu]|uniref:Uncharacterized protein n=1 Tax=Lactarius akahatsu TaxID=416441 RepID=A0AAD4Q9R3_9AGAM|nr:hypothetical protein EDB92DRAFT_2037552 [Lactarius akahatsu]
MSESQSPPAQAPPPPQPQPQHEQSQEPTSPSPYSSDTVSAAARPSRAPSPPTWACYEQIPARSELLGSSDESDSDSGDEAADEDSLSDADADADPEDPDDEADDNSSLSDDAEAAGPMDVEDDDDSLGRALGGSDGGDPEKRDKGKQRAEAPQIPGSTGTGDTATTTTNGNGDGKSSPVIPHAAAVRHRRPRSRRPPVSALRPILTIQRSQGFVWNQDLFVPPYIKDRYVASTSPPTSSGVFSACGSTSTSLGDYEIEVVEIRVRDGELDDIIP